MIRSSDRVEDRRAWAASLQSRRHSTSSSSSATNMPLLSKAGLQNMIKNPLWVFLVLLVLVFYIFFTLEKLPPKLQRPEIDHRVEAVGEEGSFQPVARDSLRGVGVGRGNKGGAGIRSSNALVDNVSSGSNSGGSIGTSISAIACPPKASMLGCHLCHINGEDGKIQTYDTQGVVKSQTQTAFDNIYKKKIWGEGGLGSGVGSTIENAEGAAYALRMIMYKYSVTRLMDAPCGALAWTESFVRSMREEIPCFTYTGVDIVQSVIDDNRRMFKDDSSFTSFFVRDISDLNQKLPPNQQLILSRDALQHLSMPLIRTSVKQYCASNATYLAVGSYITAKKNKNKNIQTGMAFSINLLAPPFNFPQPLEFFNERTRDGKYLLLYRLYPDFCEAKSVVDFMDSNSE